MALPSCKLFLLFPLTFDIRGAHQLIRARPAEHGYSTFVWYTYRTSFFRLPLGGLLVFVRFFISCAPLASLGLDTTRLVG